MTDYDALLCPDCSGYLTPGLGKPCICFCPDCEVGEPHVCPQLMYLASIADRDVIDA